MITELEHNMTISICQVVILQNIFMTHKKLVLATRAVHTGQNQNATCYIFVKFFSYGNTMNYGRNTTSVTASSLTITKQVTCALMLSQCAAPQPGSGDS